MQESKFSVLRNVRTGGPRHRFAAHSIRCASQPWACAVSNAAPGANKALEEDLMRGHSSDCTLPALNRCRMRSLRSPQAQQRPEQAS